jgi:Putative Ig domain
MPLNGPLAVSRMVAMIPNVVPMGLCSRQPGEGGYVGAPWLGREMPTSQAAELSGNVVVSVRNKDIFLYVQGQTVLPKEEDEVYTLAGIVPGTWGRFTVKKLDPEMNRNCFKLPGCLFSATVTPLSVTPSTLPSGTHGVAYSQTLAASNGYLANYTYNVVAGVLPAGLAINPATGTIAGTPTTQGEVEAFTVQVADGGGLFIVQNYSITVA